MHARFYAPGLSSDSPAVDLPLDEAVHLSRVLRLRAGDPVRVFDGRGREFSGRVYQVGRASATVTLDEEMTPVREPSVRLTLVQAVPKGDAMDRIVRDATMLGVAAILPLVSARAEASVGRLEASGRVDRWQRIAVASVKQCGRAVVPSSFGPRRWKGVWSRRSRSPLLLAEPGLLQGVRRRSQPLGEPAPAAALLIVGPEGGWTEVEAAR